MKDFDLFMKNKTILLVLNYKKEPSHQYLEEVLTWCKSSEWIEWKLVLKAVDDCNITPYRKILKKNSDSLFHTLHNI